MTLKIEGQRFGRLLALERLGSVDKKVMWRFACDCGAQVELPATRVYRGHTTSCGCLRKDQAREAVMRDVQGERFGRLLVLERAPHAGTGRVAWLCACDCGNQVTRPSKNLLNGTATSCGCRKREAGLENVRAREVDLAGQRFGRLVVAGEHSRPSRGVKLYCCVCDCGGERVSRHGDLQNGRVVSCGCAEKGPHVIPLMPERAREVCAASGATRRARKRAAGGTFTADQVQDLLVKQRGRCANCGDKLTASNMARDHRQALANGGSNHIRNIELLCRPCNGSKSAKDEIAWAQENGRLL